MLELIGETVIRKIIDAAAKAIEKKIDLSDLGTIKLDNRESKSAIEHHINMISHWAAEISFRDLRGSKKFVDSFVDLDLTLGPISTRNRGHASGHTRVTDLLQHNENVVILGDPGAGKTTSLKRLALSALTETHRSGRGKTPILVRLRDLGNSSLLSEILGILGVRVSFDDELSKESKDKTLIRIVGQYLRNLNTLLLVDGLDESPFSERENIVRDLRDIILYSKDYQVVLTCRTADFVYSFENAASFAIEPLSEWQIQSFAAKWLGEKAGEDLLKQICGTPYGGTEVLPLTLAHLCAIYERTGSIPEKPRTVYRKIVRLLLEEWDEQRSIKRESRYASFDVDRKEDFLKAIAFHLTIISKRSSFNQKDLERAYLEVYERFSVPRAEARKVAREIESHTGLIIATWSENYEFAHKSIQEYLTAEYILKLPTIPPEKAIKLPNEMALAVALSSDANEYFAAVVFAVIDRSRGTLEDFTHPFLRRTLLEKVDFCPSISLGQFVLALYSETYHPSRGQLRLPLGSGSDVFSDFLRLAPVRESVVSVMQMLQTRRQIGDVYLVLPKENASTFTMLFKSIGHYTVDNRFLELMKV